MSLWFNEDYYLRTKLAQMSPEEKAEKQISTAGELKVYMEKAGMTPEEHYNLYGRQENLNPNPYYNEDEYLLAKLEQVHSIDERDANGQPYTLETLKEAIAANGMTPIEHYERYGSHETRADGTLINPSNALDANAYAAAKLYQLQHSEDKAEAAAWADKSPADVMNAIQDAGMSPVSHYLAYGASEANADKVPMVQTVPSEQRVANDPMRAQLGENVPSNYNPPSEGPAKAAPAPVDKPADVGDLASHAISPAATAPAAPVKVPGDTGYVAPPENITDTNANPVIPPTTSGTGNVSDKWLVVNSTSSAIVVDKDGTILGEANVSIADDGAVTLPPSESAKPVDKLPPVDPDDLPPNVDAGNTGDNVKPSTPDTPDTPDVPTPSAPAAPTIDKVAVDDVIDMGEAHSGVSFTGTAQANSSVTITVKDSTTNITLTGTAEVNGTFSIQDTEGKLLDLADGQLTVTATATAGELTSTSSAAKGVTLDAAVDKTITYASEGSEGTDPFGYSKPAALTNATLGSPYSNDKGDGILNELRAVWDAGSTSNNKSLTLDAVKVKAPKIYDKLIHFSEDGVIDKITYDDQASGDHVNLDVHDVYGGGIALKLSDLNTAFSNGNTYEGLYGVIGKAYFDVPVIEATAKEAVHLEVNKVGSIHQGPLTADLLNHDLTFSSLVELFSEMKPIAVEANAPKLDILLAPSGDANIVNLMEVRGSVENITFSGAKGLFGLNIDAHLAGSADAGTVQNIDASSLTDSGSGVYVNTAPITVSLTDEISKGVNATVKEGLTFTGSAGDDILVMTQTKYGKAGTLDGGGNTEAGDTLAILVENATAGGDITIAAHNGMSGFETVAFVSLTAGQDENEGWLFPQFSADAASFNNKGVRNFITTNDLALSNYAGETVTVVGGLDPNVKLDLKASSEKMTATINLTMTSNFLNSTFAADEEPARAVLTNADNIGYLILKGADANADILLSAGALDDLKGGTLDVSDYAGDIQLANGWTYTGSSGSGSITNSNNDTISVTGVQSGTAITTEAEGSSF